MADDKDVEALFDAVRAAEDLMNQSRRDLETGTQWRSNALAGLRKYISAQAIADRLGIARSTVYALLNEAPSPDEINVENVVAYGNSHRQRMSLDSLISELVTDERMARNVAQGRTPSIAMNEVGARFLAEALDDAVHYLRMIPQSTTMMDLLAANDELESEIELADLRTDTDAVSNETWDSSVEDEVAEALKGYLFAVQDAKAWVEPFFGSDLALTSGRLDQVAGVLERVRLAENAYARALRLAGRRVPHGLRED